MVGTELNHYRVIAALGKGGMGEVYLARDLKLDRKVALKVLPSELAADPERLGRFQREARAVATLNHPNIVTLYSVEEAAGVHFLTMELVEGKVLVDVLEGGGLAVATVLELAIALADALGAAHAKGITHRDLKPQNVMITDDRRVKVLDFGLAKIGAPAVDFGETVAAVTQLHTQPGMILGTAPYMSPEQVEGASVDPRSDIFSLGIVLYELATGDRPFTGASPMSLFSSILRDEPVALHTLKADVPPGLSAIVQRCLRKEPAGRYQHGRELATALRVVAASAASAAAAAGPVGAAASGDATPCEDVDRTNVPCSACGKGNRSDAKFCGECGGPLVRLCYSCSTRLRPDARFCDACGTTTDGGKATPTTVHHGAGRSRAPDHLVSQVLKTKSLLEGERKQVTVLAVGIGGFVELASQVGAEDWHRVVDRFLGIVSDGVHRFEGTVNQISGHGLMALFGAPIAHEDHAVRACAAALHVRDELRRLQADFGLAPDLAIRPSMGLNSGEVVVRSIGDDLRMDYTAVGYTVGLADRLETLSTGERPFVAPATAQLATGFFDLEDLGPMVLPGSRGPIEVHALVGQGALRTRFDLARQRGLARLVGREAELATLDAALDRARRERGQVMGIVAEAGVGKSRLCAEFVERCRERGIAVHEARGLAHGKRTPLLPVLELFRSFFQIDEAEGVDTARTRVSASVTSLDTRLQGELPVLFRFLGIAEPQSPILDMDPESYQERLFAVIRAIVLADGARDASVLLFEDLHWLDEASDALLAEIVETQAVTRGFIVLNFRPEYRPSCRDQSYYHQLALSPLGQDPIAELVHDRVGTDPSVARLPELVFERSRGNPFFAEEILRELVESNVLEGERGSYRARGAIDRLEVPSTVQATLNARIDRLPDVEKAVLQSASVIGKTFAEAVLLEIVELDAAQLKAALRHLIDAEFLLQETLFPIVEYAFKHPLTQEVAYGTQLRDRREATHAAVASTHERLHAERLDENAALLAHHWKRAGQPLVAARWLSRAATWSGQRDYREAYEHWAAVADLVRPLAADGADADASREASELLARSAHQRTLTGFRAGTDPDELQSVFAEGRAVLERLEDWTTLALLAASFAQATQSTGDIDLYRRCAHEARRLAERSPEPVVWALANIECGWAEALSGNLREAMASTDRAIERLGTQRDMGAELIGYSPYPVGQMLWTFAAGRHGLLRECAERVEDFVGTQGGSGGPTETLVWGRLFQCFYMEMLGDIDGSIAAARESRHLADGSEGQHARVCSLGAMGMALCLAERWAEAETDLLAALELTARRVVARDLAPVYRASLIETQIHLHGPERAIETAELALQSCERWGAVTFGARTELAYARALRALGPAGHDRAAAALDRGQATAERIEARGRIPHFKRERAELARDRGDEVAYRAALDEALALWRDIGATGWVERSEI